MLSTDTRAVHQGAAAGVRAYSAGSEQLCCAPLVCLFSLPSLLLLLNCPYVNPEVLVLRHFPVIPPYPSVGLITGPGGAVLLRGYTSAATKLLQGPGT